MDLHAGLDLFIAIWYDFVGGVIMFNKYFGWLNKLPYWLALIIIFLMLSIVLIPSSLISSRLSKEEKAKVYEDGRQSGYDEGYGIGLDEGYNDGYDDGYDNAYEEAYSEGYDAGQNDGYAEGLDSGYSLAYDDGYDSGLHDGYAIGYPDGLSGNLSHDYAPYVAISGDKHFHRYICFALRDGDAFEYFGLRGDALDLGYTPCAFCTP